MTSSKPISVQALRPESKPLMMTGCETFLMVSTATGSTYEIFVSIPDCPAPWNGFPVIYVLDGNAEFLTVSETVKRVSRRPQATGIMPAVVVGIGYPNTEGFNLDRRYRDFTRCLPAEDDLADVTAQGCGGQADYIRFLQDDLLPLINDRLPVDPVSTALIGHSLAGYFVLEVLAQHPNLFSGYISFSPSVWWDRKRLEATISSANRPCRAVRLYTAVGEREQAAPAQVTSAIDEGPYAALRNRRRMIDSASEITADFGRTFADRAAVRFDIGADEDHATVVPALLCRALRFIGGVSS